MSIGLVLLAAGQGRRFGGSKLEASLIEKPVIEYILSNMPWEIFSKAVIVAANQNIADIAKKYGLEYVINDKPELGIARSIDMGTKNIQDTECCMYLVCDQPLLKKCTIENMISEYEKGSILALSCDGKRGNPVIFPTFLYKELSALSVSESGKKVINNHLDILKLYEINDSTQLLDIDTIEDLEQIKNIISEKLI